MKALAATKRYAALGRSAGNAPGIMRVQRNNLTVRGTVTAVDPGTRRKGVRVRPELDALIEKAMGKEASERFRDA